MHVLTTKDLNSSEFQVRRRLSQPTVKCKQQKRRPCMSKKLDLVVTVKLLEDTLTVLSLGKLCEGHGYSYEWTSGQKPQLIKDDRRAKCSTENYVPLVVPGLSTSSSSTATPTSTTSVSQEAVVLTLHPALTRNESTGSSIRVSTSHEPAEIEKKQLQWRQRDRTEKPVAWSARMVGRIYGESCGRKCSSSQTHPRVLLVDQL